MAWHDSLSTQIWIFAVGRGNAAFIRTGLNQGFILDLNSAGFDPAGFINKHFVGKLSLYQKQSIAQAVLSHPHADHISGCAQLKTGSPLYPSLLTCPHDKDFKDGSPSEERLNWNRIKNQDKDRVVLDDYRKLYEPRTLPLQTIRFDSNRTIPNLEYGLFYIRPPVCEKLHPTDDNAYGNSTSIMFYLRHGQNSILFPGDMTPEGMKHILDEGPGVEKRYTVFSSSWTAQNPEAHLKTGTQPKLRQLLGEHGLSILVAPHHGLESCHSPYLFGAIRGGKPGLNVISERRLVNENDGCTHTNYQCGQGAISMPVRRAGTSQNCHSVSTKAGLHTLIVFDASGPPRVSMDEKPENLLATL